jgi:hypothetical protein
MGVSRDYLAAETTAEVSIMPDGGGALPATASACPRSFATTTSCRTCRLIMKKAGVHYGESFPATRR